MNINTLYDRLSSVRLTIFLCILLAIVSVVGTVVLENLTAEQYGNLYGQGGGKLVTALGLSDLYHSVPHCSAIRGSTCFFPVSTAMRPANP